jgi:hypothetical protein
MTEPLLVNHFSRDLYMHYQFNIITKQFYSMVLFTIPPEIYCIGEVKSHPRGYMGTFLKNNASWYLQFDRPRRDTFGYRLIVNAAEIIVTIEKAMKQRGEKNPW